MKKIGIEVNGVLRDTIEKFTQLYQKYLIDNNQNEFVGQTFKIDISGNTEEIVQSEPFKYEILSDVTSLDLKSHFSFQSQDELYSFLFEDYTMEVFGHAPSTELSTFNLLNEIYYDLRNDYDLTILSDEIGKSKPATLFFLSKFGCLLEKIVFYSESTKNIIWDEIDILLTANPNLLLNKPVDKVLIKFNTKYNKHINSEYEINSLSEFKGVLKKITQYV
jgi:hypothetical protein